ncbi:kinase-like domain-containing protein [Mycena polygramma]|nr:kinase-like domain-containing protein [Mycena polygramma]
MSIEHDLSTAAGVQAYLSTTDFACNTVTPLTGGTGNYAFRLHLLAPYKGQSTLVMKHARPYVAANKAIPFAIERQAFEAKALEKIKSTLDCGPRASVPTMYHFDEEAYVLIMEDCGADAPTLKALMCSAAPPSPAVAQEIGSALGEFLGKLHAWGTVDPSMLDFFQENEQAKKITAWVTYGRLISTLTSSTIPAIALLPEPVPEEDLNDIRAIITERTEEILTSRATLTMGDFWPGNVMVSTAPDGSLKHVNVIDWELAKPGVPALDVGQFCAEMLTVTLFKPAAVDSSHALVAAFLEAYRAHSGVLAPHFANVAAKHMGAHLVAITPNVGWGTPEETVKAIEVGLEHLMEGCSDRWVRERSILNPLM